jgi:hypothetical protein
MQPNVVSESDVTRQIDRTASSVTPDATVAWTLRKGDDCAQCVLCPLGDRIELHIRMKEEILVSQHCRGPEHATFVSHTWFAALRTRGWR